jgi:hypothetical protein
MWKGTINKQKEWETNLPEIWPIWANCKKEEHGAVLQD